MQRVTRVALVKDDFVAPEAANAQVTGDGLQDAALAAEEEWTLAEAVDREPIVGHRGGNPYRSARRA